MTNFSKKFYLISDSVGETALKATNAALAQYPQLTGITMKRFPFINSLDELKTILEEANKVKAVIITTLVNEQLDEYASSFAKDHQLAYHNVVEPILSIISNQTSLAPSEQAGALHRLDDHYFDRIQAIEFAVKYDDGKNRKGFALADIILLGVSRSSKTPLSMYRPTSLIKSQTCRSSQKSMCHKRSTMLILVESLASSLPHSISRISVKKEWS